jgi:hypothetical protein
MKCSGLREFKKTVKPCGQNARYEFDGFCSIEHQQDAQKYCGSAYSEHVETYKMMLKNKALYSLFNDELRTTFVSVLEAGRKHEREQFLKSVGAKYAGFAKTAWQTVETVVKENNASLQNDIQQARNAKKTAKRVRENEPRLASIMRRSTSQDDDAPPEMSSPNPAPKSKCRFDTADILFRAVHTPLPVGQHTDGHDTDEELNDA